MNALVRPVIESDWDPITAIFNHFVTESFAAYPDRPVEAAFFRDRHGSRLITESWKHPVSYRPRIHRVWSFHQRRRQERPVLRYGLAPEAASLTHPSRRPDPALRAGR